MLVDLRTNQPLLLTSDNAKQAGNGSVLIIAQRTGSPKKWGTVHEPMA